MSRELSADFMAQYRRFMDMYVDARIRFQEARLEEYRSFKALWEIEAPVIVEKGRDQVDKYITALSLVEMKGIAEHDAAEDRYERAMRAAYDAETELELFGLALKAWTGGPYDEHVRAVGPLAYLNPSSVEEES